MDACLIIWEEGTIVVYLMVCMDLRVCIFIIM